MLNYMLNDILNDRLGYRTC